MSRLPWLWQKYNSFLLFTVHSLPIPVGRVGIESHSRISSSGQASSGLRLHFRYPTYNNVFFLALVLPFSFSVQFDFTLWFDFILCTRYVFVVKMISSSSLFTFKCTQIYLPVSSLPTSRYTCPVNVLGDCIALPKVKQSKQFTKHFEDSARCRKVCSVGVCARNVYSDV